MHLPSYFLFISQILQVVNVIREIRITAAMLDDDGRPLSVPIDYPARVHCIESKSDTTGENSLLHFQYFANLTDENSLLHFQYFLNSTRWK